MRAVVKNPFKGSCGCIQREESTSQQSRPPSPTLSSACNQFELLQVDANVRSNAGWRAWFAPTADKRVGGSSGGGGGGRASQFVGLLVSPILRPKRKSQQLQAEESCNKRYSNDDLPPKSADVNCNKEERSNNNNSDNTFVATSDNLKQIVESATKYQKQKQQQHVEASLASLNAQTDSQTSSTGLAFASSNDALQDARCNSQLPLTSADVALRPSSQPVGTNELREQQVLFKFANPIKTTTTTTTTTRNGDKSDDNNNDKDNDNSNQSNGKQRCKSPTADNSVTSDAIATTATTTTAAPARSIIKKLLIKRQQSVDSYRMARESRQRQRANAERRAANNATTMQSSCALGNNSSVAVASTHAASIDQKPNVDCRKFSMYCGAPTLKFGGRCNEILTTPPKIKVVEQNKVATTTASNNNNDVDTASSRSRPPTSLALRPTTGTGLHASASGGFIVGNFAGSITPTYATHNLPKKYSNASTVSSSLGGCTSDAQQTTSLSSFNCASTNTVNFGAAQSVSPLSLTPAASQFAASQQSAINSMAVTTTAAAATTHQLIIEANGDRADSAQAATLYDASMSSLPSNADTATTTTTTTTAAAAAAATANANAARGCVLTIGRTITVAGVDVTSAVAAAELEAAESARRAQLAEHIYDNKCGLGDDMKFLASLPELCDITFLVGETREPVCAVKSVLAARSRVFHKILFGDQIRRLAEQRAALVAAEEGVSIANGADSPGTHTSESSRRVSRASGASASPSPAPSPSPQADRWAVIPDSGSQSRAIQSVSSAVTSSLALPQIQLLQQQQQHQQLQHQQQQQQHKQQQQLVNKPLVVGPGQTAAVAPRKQRSRAFAASHARDSSRLGRMFSKRASDPSIKQQRKQANANQHLANANQTYLDKMSKSQTSTTMIIEEFEPDVFRQLIEYIHTGCVLLQARTLLGLLNAADYYGLEQLRKACLRFVTCCITVDTVCSLLSTAERYIQYKCTKTILQKVLEFVDSHATEVLKLNAFGLLPEHVVRLILARDNLQADELVKYNGVLTWCEHYCRQFELTNVADVMCNFLDLIQLHKIPTNVLISEIYPTHVVPDLILMRALAHQADPDNFEPPQTVRQRRMTLPNLHAARHLQSSAATATANAASANQQQQQSQKHQQQQQHQQQLRARKSHQLRKATLADSNNEQQQQQLLLLQQHSASAKRKGSLAQVSLGNVKRFSRKLSAKSRRANAAATRANSTLSFDGFGFVARKRIPFSTNSSVVNAATNNNNNSLTQADADKDAMAIGRQVVDAYIARQQRQLREQELLRAAAAVVAGDELHLAGNAHATTNTASDSQRQHTNQHSTIRRTPTAPGQLERQTSRANKRKSLRDFKQLMRVFSRLSPANRLLRTEHSLEQQQQLQLHQGTNSITATTTTSQQQSSISSKLQTFTATTTSSTKPTTTASNNARSRTFKRSETVFESSTGSTGD